MRGKGNPGTARRARSLSRLPERARSTRSIIPTPARTPRPTDRGPRYFGCNPKFLRSLDAVVSCPQPRDSQRQLPCLLIGAHAVLAGEFENPRDILFHNKSEENRSHWLDLFRELGYRFFHGVTAFAQFEPPDETGVPVDLMFVDATTWQKLAQDAVEADLGEVRALVPRPEYLVALKLHAAVSPTRSKPEVDWEDIRQIVRICALDPSDESFRALILRYGGEDALARIHKFVS